jgi:N-carbamoylputrescine amidase
MRNTVVAAVQLQCSWNQDENVQKAESFIRKASLQGANIILLQELFSTPYFCQQENPEYFRLASPLENCRIVRHFQKIAEKLNVVLPISFFEQKNNAHYNSVAIIDAGGEILGVYRKTHIPDGPGYEEKYYFNPGDTGFKVWDSQYGKIGVGICWDQWFPEAARSMALLGAEILLYPTAIGSEPGDHSIDSKNHWQITMRGHAGANILPVMAANRVGTEKAGNSEIQFYGSSFIAGPTGEILTEADRNTEGIITAEFDLDQIADYRRYWGVFRDRRPEMYQMLLTNDGIVK